MPGRLYIIATPIGNLSDISERALGTLQSVDLILAEDTRVTQKLLSKYDIKTKALSYHHHSPESKKLEILNRLQMGESLALVTDAGTPGISDPGNELLDFLYSNSRVTTMSPFAGILADSERPSKNSEKGDEEGTQIIAIPGPSSLSTALSICGFNTSKFIFAGFFPKKKANKWVNTYFTQSITTIYFDSPHRLIKNLEKLHTEIGDKRVFVARELTKLHEETYRDHITKVIEKLKTSNPKGEVVVVIEG